MGKKEFVRPTLEQFEVKLGKAKEWEGRCFEIASAAVRHKFFPKGSVAVYGHWIGPIAEKSMFNIGTFFAQHGWVQIPDGSVCDLTRWGFTCEDPFIYWGKNDHYDEGGNIFRTASFGECPKFDTKEEIFSLKFPGKAHLFVAVLINNVTVPPGTMTKSQLFWLANQAPQILAPHTKDIYTTLGKADFRGLVPIDNWKMIFRDSVDT